MGIWKIDNKQKEKDITFVKFAIVRIVKASLPGLQRPDGRGRGERKSSNEEMRGKMPKEIERRDPKANQTPMKNED